MAKSHLSLSNTSPAPPIYSTNSPRLLATAYLDGTIIIWGARTLSLSQTPTLAHGPASPFHAMPFTTDTYLIASGNTNIILIWKADEGGLPEASWKGDLGKMRMVNGHGSGGRGRVARSEKRRMRSQGRRRVWVGLPRGRGLGRDVAVRYVLEI